MWTTPRRYPRFKIALPVEIRPIGSSVPLRTQTGDISLGGFYAELTFTQEVSTEVDVVLWIGEAKLQAKGVVVSKHPAFGNGIKFTQLAGKDRESLEELLDCLGPRLVQSNSSGGDLPVEHVAD